MVAKASVMLHSGFQIKVVEGSDRGGIHPLDSPKITIGRRPPGAIRQVGWIYVADETVSSLQAELRWNGDTRRFRLHNLSQTNPTKVNGQDVEEWELTAGDQIQIGRSTLDFQAVDFRFGAQRPAREPRAETMPPPDPTPPPLSSSEAAVTTAPLKVQLTRRSALSLVVTEGPSNGQWDEVRGLSITLGGPIDPDTAPKRPGFDQDFALADVQLPPRCLGLTWKELDQCFEVTSFDPSLPLRVYRFGDGMMWSAVPDPGQPALVRADDTLELGRNRVQLVNWDGG